MFIYRLFGTELCRRIINKTLSNRLKMVFSNFEHTSHWIRKTGKTKRIRINRKNIIRYSKFYGIMFQLLSSAQRTRKWRKTDINCVNELLPGQLVTNNSTTKLALDLFRFNMRYTSAIMAATVQLK